MSLRSQLKRRVEEDVQFQLGRPIVGGRLARIWWVVALRAVVSVLFGVAGVVWPRHTAFALVGFFGIFALIDGAAALVASLQAGPRTRRWLALAGTSSVVAGLFAFSAPTLAALMLIRVLGVWLILRGASEWLAAASLRAADDDSASMRLAREHRYVAFNGAMSMLFGIGLLAAPRIGALSLVWALGGWAVLHGLLMFRWALQIRRPAT